MGQALSPPDKTKSRFLSLMDFFADSVIIGHYNCDLDGVWYEEIVRNRKGDAIDSKIIQVSPIPIIPVAILDNIDSSIEKVELAIFKYGRWKRIITERSTIANRNSIIKLANDGVEVNSDNVGQLIRYLADVIANSLSTMSHKSAKSVMGWVDNKFLPYADDIFFDGDDTFKYLYKSISTKSDLKEWCEFVQPLRENVGIRLCMAASFASPLIEKIGENPFIFHLWGGTGAGKSCALMVAMSIWGDPTFGRMTRTMNMTQNSMLSTAAFLKNLPFAGDELQTIKSTWSNYDQLIMRITEGIDRARMSFDKVNETKSWKCSFIFSGEDPCIRSASGGGAKNRVIEYECKEKLVSNGNQVANFVRTHFGCAGKPYIDKIIEKESELLNKYTYYFNEILSKCDTTDKQAGSAAIMLVADELAREAFFQTESALTVDNIIPYLASTNNVDVTERAYQFICDKIAENEQNFRDGGKTRWGYIENGICYFNRSVLDKILLDAGFELGAMLDKWHGKNYIMRCDQKNFRIRKRVNGIVTSCIAIVLPKEEDTVDVNEIDSEELPF